MVSQKTWHLCMSRFFDADRRAKAAADVSVGRMQELYRGKDKPLPYNRLSFVGKPAALREFLSNMIAA